MANRQYEEVLEKERQIAAQIASMVDDEERKVLLQWIEQLNKIISSDANYISKISDAVSATCSSDVMIAVAKIVAKETQSRWENCGASGRLAAIGAGAGLLLFGTQGAGIAALGTAIGLPLWIVLGAGGAFIGVLYEELTRSKD